jgi:hypothetical protein
MHEWRKFLSRGPGLRAWTLQRLIGVARAKELLMMPPTVPAADMLAESLTLARQLAEGPTVAYGVRQAGGCLQRDPCAGRVTRP